ncbi:hypothetical protein Clacol_001086 [Clathrus columnatus]|uniref:Uncharacterized protein n=1 Tax=Clathrus columnatus TaxID=1419009 RepID=A0AAV5A1K7_9AGAM|nr:hypothetical protein Clacol_001086 [Clathrus columnatus]
MTLVSKSNSSKRQLCIVLLSCVLIMGAILGYYKTRENENDTFTKVRIVKPGLAPQWKLKELQYVKMLIQDTVHYNATIPESKEEFARLMPSGGHQVHIDDDDNNHTGPYTVALFHQLKCLDIISQAYRIQSYPGELERHCLNYLRQSVLCIADNRLESVRSPVGPRIVSFSSDYICKDWSAVYDAAEVNHKAYKAAKAKM